MSEQVCKHCGQEIVIAAKGRGGAGFWRLSRSGQIFDGTHYHEPSPEPDAAPTSEAQAPAAPDSEIRKCIKNTFGTFFITGGRQYRYNESDRVALVELLKPLEAELAQLRARFAILDAQEVGLPPLPPTSDEEYNTIARMRPHAPRNTIINVVRANKRERQLLDALRAVQAKNELLRIASEEVQERRNLNGLPPLDHIGRWEHKLQLAYDALAGKGE